MESEKKSGEPGELESEKEKDGSGEEAIAESPLLRAEKERKSLHGNSSPEHLLNHIGKESTLLLQFVSCASLAWASGAFLCMTASFYDTKPANSTFVTLSEEFSLPGDASLVRELAASSFMVGNMVGGSAVSPLADAFGRRPVLVAASAACLLATLGAAFAPSIEFFIAFRTLQGVFYTGMCQSSWVLGYEHCSPSLRPTATLLFGLAWVFGYCLLSPVAALVSSWRHLLLVSAIPLLLLLLAAIFFIPESIYFLISKGQSKKIEKWLHRLSKETSEDVEELKESLVEKKENTEENGDERKSKLDVFKEIWRHKKIFLYLCIMCCIWVCDTFIYFGLSFYSTSLAGNIYLNYLLIGIIEVPASILTPKVMIWFKRKTVVIGCHLMFTLSFIALIFLPENSWFTIAGWVFGKFAISIAFMAVYVLGSEVFSTEIRITALAICSVLSRFGGILSPYVTALNRLGDWVPLATFAGVGCLAAVVMLPLPETKDQPLPATIANSVKKRNKQASVLS